MTGLLRFRGRLVVVFAATALALPPTSAFALEAGWPPQLVGGALAAMTIAGVVTAPAWGALDDRVGARGLATAAVVSAAAAIALCCAALAGFEPRAVIPALIIFGIGSGALDAMVSARIQRRGLTHALPRLRGYGSLGWAVGLALASLLVWAGLGAWVFAAAALCCLALALLGYREPVVAVAVDAPTVHRGALSPPVLLLLLVGLPVPVAAYGYLLYSSTALDALGGIAPGVPLLTLLVLAVIEVPVFALIAPLIAGRRITVLYAVLLLLLAASWLPFVMPTPDWLRTVALLPYTLAVVVWSSTQPAMVRSFAPNRAAGLAQATAASLTKCAAAVVSGVGIGAIDSAFGGRAAPLALLVLALAGMLLLSLAIRLFPDLRSVTVPAAVTPIERTHHAHCDR